MSQTNTGSLAGARAMVRPERAEVGAREAVEACDASPIAYTFSPKNCLLFYFP